jgi:MSHA biogenesis protein MshE
MVEAMRSGDPQDFANAALRSPNFIPLADSAMAYLDKGMTSIEEVAKLVEDMGESKIPLSEDLISQQGSEG